MNEMDLDWVTEYRWQILKAIKECKQLKNAEISDETGIDPGSVSRNVDKLAKLNLVDRDYKKEYYLTDRGNSAAKHLQGLANIMKD